MNGVLRVAEGAPEVGTDVGATESAIRMGRLGLERRHSDPRWAAVGRHFRCAVSVFSEK